MVVPAHVGQDAFALTMAGLAAAGAQFDPKACRKLRKRALRVLRLLPAHHPNRTDAIRNIVRSCGSCSGCKGV